jgi:predicted RNase H-like HicB family nuclease
MKRSIPKYEIILYWSSDDSAVIAEVPELPGCAADGRNYHEALANVEEQIQEWIETAEELGRPIPIPCGRLLYA